MRFAQTFKNVDDNVLFDFLSDSDDCVTKLINDSSNVDSFDTKSNDISSANELFEYLDNNISSPVVSDDISCSIEDTSENTIRVCSNISSPVEHNLSNKHILDNFARKNYDTHVQYATLEIKNLCNNNCHSTIRIDLFDKVLEQYDVTEYFIDSIINYFINYPQYLKFIANNYFDKLSLNSLCTIYRHSGKCYKNIHPVHVKVLEDNIDKLVIWEHICVAIIIFSMMNMRKYSEKVITKYSNIIGNIESIMFLCSTAAYFSSIYLAKLIIDNFGDMQMKFTEDVTNFLCFESDAMYCYEFLFTLAVENCDIEIAKIVVDKCSDRLNSKSEIMVKSIEQIIYAQPDEEMSELIKKFICLEDYSEEHYKQYVECFTKNMMLSVMRSR